MKIETRLKLAEQNFTSVLTRKKLLEESKVIFNSVAKELFETHSALEEFSWTQYTPYFNDGDTCYFGVGEALINGEEGESEWSIKYAKERGASQEEIAALEVIEKITSDVQELLDSIGQDCLEEMFGDHAQITVTKDSIVVDEYVEHD